MTRFEQAFISAAKEFLQTYGYEVSIKGTDAQPDSVLSPETPPENNIWNEPEASSNGVPICSRHGRAMKLGKFGYFCTQRESDPEYSNKNGYCNYKRKG